jgi:xanthine dehydrogenase molybdopterin-binding subunit B
LQGALATTQVAAGTIVSVDVTPALAMPGVVRVLTKSDIPAGASNEIGAIVLQETLFLGAGDEVKCVALGRVCVL